MPSTAMRRFKQTDEGKVCADSLQVVGRQLTIRVVISSPVCIRLAAGICGNKWAAGSVRPGQACVQGGELTQQQQDGSAHERGAPARTSVAFRSTLPAGNSWGSRGITGPAQKPGPATQNRAGSSPHPGPHIEPNGCLLRGRGDGFESDSMPLTTAGGSPQMPAFFWRSTTVAEGFANADTEVHSGIGIMPAHGRDRSGASVTRPGIRPGPGWLARLRARNSCLLVFKDRPAMLRHPRGQHARS